MLYRFVFLLAGLACLLAAGGRADAHPHVWVTMTEELLYAPDGSVTGVRHAWTFDDMFSTFATQGIAQKTKGEFTREELGPLAKVNVESLKDYAYFTYARIDGKRHQGRIRRPGRLLSRLRSERDGADAALHAALQGAGESQGA